MRVVSYLSLAVMAATVLSIAPQRLHAQGAQVEQTPGNLSAFGGFYAGACNNVKTPSGNITVTLKWQRVPFTDRGSKGDPKYVKHVLDQTCDGILP